MRTAIPPPPLSYGRLNWKKIVFHLKPTQNSNKVKTRLDWASIDKKIPNSNAFPFLPTKHIGAGRKPGILISSYLSGKIYVNMYHQHHWWEEAHCFFYAGMCQSIFLVYLLFLWVPWNHTTSIFLSYFYAKKHSYSTDIIIWVSLGAFFWNDLESCLVSPWFWLKMGG